MISVNQGVGTSVPETVKNEEARDVSHQGEPLNLEGGRSIYLDWHHGWQHAYLKNLVLLESAGWLFEINFVLFGVF